MMRMIEKFVRNLKNNNDKVAYKINSLEITYKDLAEKAEKLAKSLKCQGTSPVILYGHKSINMVVSIIACLIAKRAYVPVDVYTPLDRIKKIIKLTNSDFADGYALLKKGKKQFIKIVK